MWCSTPSSEVTERAWARASSLYPATPSSTEIATSSAPCHSLRSLRILRRARLSLPPETATPTRSPRWIMRCLTIVLLVFSTTEPAKHPSQSTSPEYRLVKNGLPPHLVQKLKVPPGGGSLC